jgi:hypothetical protein
MVADGKYSQDSIGDESVKTGVGGNEEKCEFVDFGGNERGFTLRPTNSALRSEGSGVGGIRCPAKKREQGISPCSRFLSS